MVKSSIVKFTLGDAHLLNFIVAAKNDKFKSMFFMVKENKEI